MRTHLLRVFHDSLMGRNHSRVCFSCGVCRADVEKAVTRSDYTITEEERERLTQKYAEGIDDFTDLIVTANDAIIELIYPTV